MSDPAYPTWPAEPTAGPSSVEWTPERRIIRRLLVTRAPSLAGLYDAALLMLENPNFPARRMLIAHCVREIANSLPWFFEGAEKGTVSYAPLERIFDPWRDAGLPIGEEPPPVSIDNASPVTPELVQVPSGIVREIGNLLRDHKSGNGRVRRNAELIFRALDPVGGPFGNYQTPTLDLWLKTRMWFVENVHHGRQRSDVDNGELDPEFHFMFEQFEVILGALAQPFLEVVKSLDEDLDQANS